MDTEPEDSYILIRLTELSFQLHEICDRLNDNIIMLDSFLKKVKNLDNE